MITQKAKVFILLLVTVFSLAMVNKVKVGEWRSVDIIGVRGVEVNGEVHRLGIENKRTFPVVLVFLDIGCVISQRQIPELNRLHQFAVENGVKFYGVVSNASVSWEEAREFKQEFDLKFPMIFDANGDLSNRLKPTVVPECFVFDIYDNRLYSGRINDQFADIGKVNKNPKHADLKMAIAAAGKGEMPPYNYQDAIGCIFEPFNQNRELTYNKDIEPIIRANCSSCHQPGDIGPFSLLSYKDVAKRSRMVEYVTRKRFMPIWKAEPGVGKFSNEHRLSDYQIDLIKRWVASGKPEGKPGDLMPESEKKMGEWKLGTPDLVLKMEPYSLPAEGEDQYRVLVMKNAIPKGKVIKAIDFKPGDASVVHHTTIFVDYSKKLRGYDAADPLPGYDAFEQGGTMEFGSAVPVCGWAPGIGPYVYPEGVGFYVEDNADLAFENHYHLSGKATSDQSYVGIYFAKEPVKKYMTGSIIGTQKLQIPAGEKEFTKSIWAYVPADIELFDFTPHMHYIGKEVEVSVTYPNGEVKPLIQLKDWDLRWQNVYTLRELTLIPKGSIISATFKYDNSEDNYDNPNSPPAEMYWGWGSEDEMCEVYFSYIPKDLNDYGKMLTASFATFEHFYPVEERVEVGPENLEQIADRLARVDLWSREGQILLLSAIESCQGDALVKILKGRDQSDPNLKTNLAQLMMTTAFLSFDERRMYADGEKAAVMLYEVLDQHPQHWSAGFAYGSLLLSSGEPKSIKEGVEVLEALMTGQEAVEKQEKFAQVYWELGKYYYSLKQDDKAEAVLQRGLKHHPNHPDLKQELASDGRIVKKTLK